LIARLSSGRYYSTLCAWRQGVLESTNKDSHTCQLSITSGVMTGVGVGWGRLPSGWIGTTSTSPGLVMRRVS